MMGILWGDMWQVRAAMGSHLPGGLRHPQALWGSCLAPTGLSDMALGGSHPSHPRERCPVLGDPKAAF